MLKKLFLTTLMLLGMLILGNSKGYAQAGNGQVKNKTVVYKMKKKGEVSPVTAQMAIDIDKLLPTKKGIISSLTNVNDRSISVKMDPEFQEEVVTKLLLDVFKLEIGSYEIITNTE